MLVHNDWLLLLLCPVLGVLARIGASKAVYVENGVVVAILGVVDEFLERVLILLADGKQGAILVNLLDVLVVLRLDHLSDLADVPAIVLPLLIDLSL